MGVVRTRYDFEHDELAALLIGEPAYRVSQVFDGLHGGLRTPAELTNVPLELRSSLEEQLPSALRVAQETTSDESATTKWAFSLHDGAVIETVLMAYRDRVTVCVSSQAGCAMGCTFCATGQGGFGRHLSTGEIVEQVVVAARAALPRRLSNIVFMGMGEPLANYDRVLSAVRRINGPLGIGARKMTISTVGVIPGIRRLAAEDLEVGLAVSLHAANDAKRDTLVPLNRRYPLGQLADACEAYVETTHRRLQLRVGTHRGGERHHHGRLRARCLRPSAPGPREPHPAQPDPGLPGARLDARAGEVLRCRARRRGGHRDRPQHPGSRDRCGLRAAGVSRRARAIALGRDRLLDLSGPLRPEVGEELG